MACGDARPEGFTHLACAVSYKRPASLRVVEPGGPLFGHFRVSLVAGAEDIPVALLLASISSVL